MDNEKFYGKYKMTEARLSEIIEGLCPDQMDGESKCWTQFGVRACACACWHHIVPALPKPSHLAAHPLAPGHLVVFAWCQKGSMPKTISLGFGGGTAESNQKDIKCLEELEKLEESIEAWWAIKEDLAQEADYADLEHHLCFDTAQVCCQAGTYGPQCTTCPGLLPFPPGTDDAATAAAAAAAGGDAATAGGGGAAAAAAAAAGKAVVGGTPCNGRGKRVGFISINI
jgi:hypothetical protein